MLVVSEYLQHLPGTSRIYNIFVLFALRWFCNHNQVYTLRSIPLSFSDSQKAGTSLYCPCNTLKWKRQTGRAEEWGRQRLSPSGSFRCNIAPSQKLPAKVFASQRQIDSPILPVPHVPPYYIHLWASVWHNTPVSYLQYFIIYHQASRGDTIEAAFISSKIA